MRGGEDIVVSRGKVGMEISFLTRVGSTKGEMFRVCRWAAAELKMLKMGCFLVDAYGEIRAR